MGGCGLRNPPIRVIRVLHPLVKGLILAWLPGNLLSDGLFGYTYDSANRPVLSEVEGLTEVVSGTLTTEYLYNGDGIWVAQIAAGLRTGYVQDVAAPLPQVLTARQGGTVSKYLRGLGLIGKQQGGTGPNAGPAVWQYPLPDALGSVRQVAGPAGQVLLTRRYDPFGGLQTASGIVHSNYGFAGEEQDPDSDQLFLRARTYNPATGRFLQADPVPGQLDRPASLHRYAYAFNNPVNIVDPSGLMPPGLGATRAHRYAPTFGSPALPDINYAAPPPTQRSSGYPAPLSGTPYSTMVDPWAAARSVNAAEAARSTYSDPYARQQSQGHLPKPCSLGDLLTGLFAPSSNGSLLHELAGFGLHAMQTGSLASDLGDWLGYNLATSYYQFEQWLANPAHFQLALGILVITTAIVVTGGAAIPAIMFGAAVGASLDLGGQAWGMFDAYRHGRPIRPLDWGSVGWSAFGGAVESAAFSVLGAVLTPVGFIAGKGLGIGSKLGLSIGNSLSKFGAGLIDDTIVRLGSLTDDLALLANRGLTKLGGLTDDLAIVVNRGLNKLGGLTDDLAGLADRGLTRLGSLSDNLSGLGTKLNWGNLSRGLRNWGSTLGQELGHFRSRLSSLPGRLGFNRLGSGISNLTTSLRSLGSRVSLDSLRASSITANAIEQAKKGFVYGSVTNAMAGYLQSSDRANYLRSQEMGIDLLVGGAYGAAYSVALGRGFLTPDSVISRATARRLIGQAVIASGINVAQAEMATYLKHKILGRENAHLSSQEIYTNAGYGALSPLLVHFSLAGTKAMGSSLLRLGARQPAESFAGGAARAVQTWRFFERNSIPGSDTLLFSTRGAGIGLFIYGYGRGINEGLENILFGTNILPLVVK